MTSIQGLGDSQSIAQLLLKSQISASSPAQQVHKGHGKHSAPANITNDQGQSLLDIQDELQTAIQDALNSVQGGNAGQAVQKAVDSTLEQNGFDVSQVKSAMLGSMNMSSTIGQFGAGAAAGTDVIGSPQLSGSSQIALNSFLQQFGPGVNLDATA